MNLPLLIHSVLLLVHDPRSAHDEFQTPLLRILMKICKQYERNNAKDGRSIVSLVLKIMRNCVKVAKLHLY
jgi:uncharacterized protein (DUF2267 family)